MCASRETARFTLISIFAVALPGPVVCSARDSQYEFIHRQIVTDHTIYMRKSYNYAPALIKVGLTYHLYWCGGVAGDFILHAQASSIDGPWHSQKDAQSSNSYDISLMPTESPSDFDGLHTCDPSVIQIGDHFYLYYSGEAVEHGLTAIGVAASSDAVHFTRQNAGKPIVEASETNASYRKSPALSYGAGQPTVTYIDPYLYLSFTDSTARGVNHVNGAGQIALRSTDPLFSNSIEELTATGWQRRAAGKHTGEYSFTESFGLDWGYDRQTGMIVAVTDRIPKQVSILFFEPSRLDLRGKSELDLDWHEGPALLTDGKRGLLTRPNCTSLPVTVSAAQGMSNDPWSWNKLGYSTAEISVGPLCVSSKGSHSAGKSFH